MVKILHVRIEHSLNVNVRNELDPFLSQKKKKIKNYNISFSFGFTADFDDGNRLINLINKIKGNDGSSVAGVGMSYTGYKG